MYLHSGRASGVRIEHCGEHATRILAQSGQGGLEECSTHIKCDDLILRRHFTTLSFDELRFANLISDICASTANEHAKSLNLCNYVENFKV